MWAGLPKRNRVHILGILGRKITCGCGDDIHAWCESWDKNQSKVLADSPCFRTDREHHSLIPLALRFPEQTALLTLTVLCQRAAVLKVSLAEHWVSLRRLQVVCRVMTVLLTMLRHYFPFSLYWHHAGYAEAMAAKTALTCFKAVAAHCAGRHSVLTASALQERWKQTNEVKCQLNVRISLMK